MADKKKILVIDDEKNFTDMVKLNLDLTDEYDVKTENKSLNALAAAKEFDPDLIFLDIIMPDMDGGEVLAQLKEDVYTRDIPVVFLTAIVAADEANTIGGIISGYPALSKPVSVTKLIDAIKRNIK